MYICVCSPFSDKDVKAKLEAMDGKATVKEVYRCCSGGQKPNCGSCMDTLKDMVAAHNNKLNVADLKRGIASPAPVPAHRTKKPESV